MSSSRKRSLSSGSQAGSGGLPPPPQKSTLLAWAKSRRTASSSTAKAQQQAKADAAALRSTDGSAFYTCPLCGQGFPLTMQSHADNCQGEKEPRTKSRPALNDVVVVLEEEEEEEEEEKDEKKGDEEDKEEEKETGMQKAAAATTAAGNSTLAPSQGSAATPIQSSPPPPPTSASSISNPGFQPPSFFSPPPLPVAPAALPTPSRPMEMKGGKNAFDILKRASAVQYRKEVFTLSRNLEDGTLDWTWGGHTSPSSQATTQAQDKQQQQQQQHQHQHEEQWWEKEIALPGSKTARLLLRTNFFPPAPSSSSSSPSHPQRHHLSLPDIPLSVLKSALQKNVRRSRGEAAAKVGLQLLHRAPLELYRRLPIIMLEDGVCHPPALVVFTWLMMAGETYTPDAALRKVLVRMLFEVASGPFTDFASRLYHHVLDPLPDVDEASLTEEGEGGEGGGLPPECQVLLRCLVARRHYGGMACDSHMLRNLAKLWHLRVAVRDEDRNEGVGKYEEEGSRHTTAVHSPALASLVDSPRLAATPAPSWRRPFSASSSAYNSSRSSSSSSKLSLSSLSIAPLDYVSERKLKEYLDAPRPWCRWLIWHVQSQGRPLPQAWLPSLATMPGESAVAVSAGAAGAAAAGATAATKGENVTPPLENWPAVWRLCVASGGGTGQEGDIPWSAIDFHVSGVVDEICQYRLSPEEKRRLASLGGGRGGGRGGGEGEEEEVVKGLLRSAMWRFSSSVTDKVSVLLPPAQGDRKKQTTRPQAQGEEGEDENEEEDGLREVWNLLRPLAHAYAQIFIKRRCTN